jgi:hypothetical protein
MEVGRCVNHVVAQIHCVAAGRVAMQKVTKS